MSELLEQPKPYRERLASRTQERDIIRISGFLGKSGWTEEKNLAVLEILKWVKTDIPAHARDGKSFELLHDRGNTDCIAFSIDDSMIWGIRTEDKRTLGRTWITEIILEKKPSEETRIGLRLLLTSDDMDNNFSPTTPGCIKNLIETVEIYSATNKFFATSRDINDKNSYMEFEDHLLNPKRQVPLIVISADSKAKNYAIDPQKIAKAVTGIAHVYCLNFEKAWSLSEKVGKTLSVFDGGIRVYMPGFDESANPGAHRLVTKLFLKNNKRKNFAIRELHRLVAQDSIRRNRLGREILSYSSVNSLRLETETKKLETDATKLENNAAKLETETQKLEIRLRKGSELEKSLRNQIISLNKSHDEIKEQADQTVEWATDYQKRAENAEEDKNGLIAQVQILKEFIKQSGEEVPQSTYPDSWKKVAAWVQENLSGHLELTASAKKGLKNSQYELIEMVCKCLEWLAYDYRRVRMTEGGGDEAKNNYRLYEGILNSLCGGHEYEFEHEGQKYKADWHIKIGGNTRDPKRCLRIYYTWDESSNMIIVSDLPAHRETQIS